jgi:hypothetical protein
MAALYPALLLNGLNCSTCCGLGVDHDDYRMGQKHGWSHCLPFAFGPFPSGGLSWLRVSCVDVVQTERKLAPFSMMLNQLVQKRLTVFSGLSSIAGTLSA